MAAAMSAPAQTSVSQWTPRYMRVQATTTVRASAIASNRARTAVGRRALAMSALIISRAPLPVT